MTELKGGNGLQRIEEILKDEMPATGVVTTLTGGKIQPHELCRVLAKDDKGKLLHTKARFIGTDEGIAIFVDREAEVPTLITIPEQSISKGVIGVLPEPKLPNSGQDIDQTSAEALKREMELRTRRPRSLSESITTFDNQSYWGA